MRTLASALALLFLVRGAAADDPKPLTDEECLAFARALEEAVAKGDLDAVIGHLDWDALLDRVTAGADQGEMFVRTFRASFKSGQRQPGQLFSTITAAVQQGGSYTFLRIREKDGGKRALFRLVLPNTGVNYHDYVLQRGKDGRVRGLDLYVFLSAENVSVTVRRVFLPGAAEFSKGLVERLLTSESEFVKHLDEIQSITTHTSAGRPAEALRVYRSLPASVRADKSVLLMRLMAAQAAGEAEYEAAFKDFKLHCPDDPCIDMLAIDSHILGKRYDDAIAAIDRIEAAVGGDPYCDVLRANVLYLKGDRAASADRATKAIAAEPKLLQAHWVLVQISLDEKRFDETARLLLRIEKDFELEFGDLKDVPDYGEFVKSDAYRKWLKRGK